MGKCSSPGKPYGTRRLLESGESEAGAYATERDDMESKEAYERVLSQSSFNFLETEMQRKVDPNVHLIEIVLKNWRKFRKLLEESNLYRQYSMYL
jgi:hypothetical protein